MKASRYAGRFIPRFSKDLWEKGINVVCGMGFVTATPPGDANPCSRPVKHQHIALEDAGTENGTPTAGFGCNADLDESFAGFPE